MNLIFRRSNRYLSLQELAIDCSEWVKHLPIPEDTEIEISDFVLEEELTEAEDKQSLHSIFEKHEIRESLQDMIVEALGQSKSRAIAVILQYVKDTEALDDLQEYIDTSYS